MLSFHNFVTIELRMEIERLNVFMQLLVFYRLTLSAIFNISLPVVLMGLKKRAFLYQ